MEEISEKWSSSLLSAASGYGAGHIAVKKRNDFVLDESV
jgi:hypothetical protein